MFLLMGMKEKKYMRRRDVGVGEPETAIIWGWGGVEDILSCPAGKKGDEKSLCQKSRSSMQGGITEREWESKGKKN